MHVLSDKLCDDRLNTFPLSSFDEDILKIILFFKNLFIRFKNKIPFKLYFYAFLGIDIIRFAVFKI